jgi:hypothetical protein
MTPSRTVLVALVGLLVASTALAGPPNRNPTRSPTRGQPSRPTPLVLSCGITPASPPGRNLFQTTDVTVTVTSGNLGADRKVEIVLGIDPSGPVLGSACSSDFGRDRRVTTTVTIAPQITDPDYIWQCNARQVRAACDPPVAPPR